MHIKLAAETIVNLGPLPITNAMIGTWVVIVLLFIVSILATCSLTLIPGKLQNFVELILETIYTLTENLAHQRTYFIFPLITTFFLFIIVSNWFGLLPGIGTIGFFGTSGFLPILRAPNSDLNTTLALALVSAITTHAFSIKVLGVFAYIKKFISINPIVLFVGLLELVSEVTKILSLSLRLFGNIFAGESLLTTVSAMGAFLVPVPFMALEVLVGFVQAIVFMMLTLVFMVILSEKHTDAAQAHT